jgi:hypothetical protein
MYREDLDKLVAVFRKSCQTVVSSDNENRYESLEEMKGSVGPRITTLDIRGEGPGVHCLFNQRGSLQVGDRAMQYIYNELRTEETTDAADAVCREIRDYLKGFERGSFRKPCIVGVVIGVIGALWFAIHNSYVKDGRAVLGSLPGFLVSAVILCIFVGWGVSVRTYLSLETKRNSQSFFVRNWEEFAKHAVTSLISVIIGLVVGYLLGRYLK